MGFAMSDDVIDFPGKRARTARRKAKSHSLCREGHHRWQVDKQRGFDTRSGKLLTTRVCQRCGITKTTAD